MKELREYHMEGDEPGTFYRKEDVQEAIIEIFNSDVEQKELWDLVGLELRPKSEKQAELQQQTEIFINALKGMLYENR